MKTKIHYDVFIAVGIIFFMMFLWHTSNGFVYANETARFPKIVITVIIILAAIMLMSGIKKSKAKMNNDADQTRVPFLKKYGKPLLVYGLFVIYLLVFYFANFFVATAIMLVGLMWYFGVRDWKPLIIIPICFLTLAYFVFVKILSVNLI